MSFVQLKKQIKTVVDGLSEIQQVSDYPTENFNGYPAIVIRTMGVENEYETTDQNYEEYIFNLYLIVENSEDIESKQETRSLVEELCDTLRDTFDSDEFLDGVSLPSDRQMLGVRPAVAEIDEDENGKYVTATIVLKCRVNKQV